MMNHRLKMITYYKTALNSVGDGQIQKTVFQFYNIVSIEVSLQTENKKNYFR